MSLGTGWRGRGLAHVRTTPGAAGTAAEPAARQGTQGAGEGVGAARDSAVASPRAPVTERAGLAKDGMKISRMGSGLLSLSATTAATAHLCELLNAPEPYPLESLPACPLWDYETSRLPRLPSPGRADRECTRLGVPKPGPGPRSATKGPPPTPIPDLSSCLV